MKAPALFLVILLAAVALLTASGCSKSICPNNYSNISGSATPSQSKENQKSGPAKAIGKTDKDGRLVKKNAYHPSTAKAGK